MSIPIATTRITIKRPTEAAQDADPWGSGYDDPPPPSEPVEGQLAVVTSGVRATISAGGARGSSNGGESESVEFRLTCDPADLTYLDTVLDESTGTTYSVAWALTTPGVAGLGHTVAGLTTTKGQTS